jgi:hypothetical protein
VSDLSLKIVAFFFVPSGAARIAEPFGGNLDA